MLTASLEELGLPSDVLVWQAILLTVVSLGVGVLGGFVGLALGTMRLPMLLFIGVPMPIAAGTNIMVSTASAFTGAVRHYREGRVDLRIVLVLGLPAFIGAFVGGFTGQLLPESALISIVGVLVFWQGIELTLRAWRNRPQQAGVVGGANKRFDYGTGRIITSGGAGFGVGLLAGAVGLILGTLRLPIIIQMLGADPRLAAGTNLFIGFIMGTMGWIGHLTNGQVDFPVLIMMAGSAMVGSYYGAKLTDRVELRKLVATMGVILLISGVVLIVRAATV